MRRFSLLFEEKSRSRTHGGLLRMRLSHQFASLTAASELPNECTGIATHGILVRHPRSNPAGWTFAIENIATPVTVLDSREQDSNK